MMAKSEPEATPEGAANAARSRMAAIDVLRGAAIVWVIGFHLAVNLGGLDAVDDHYTGVTSRTGDLDLFGAAEALWHLVWRLGYQGVPLFMMLSGFAITLNALRSPETLSPLRFYGRRFKAILAPYWIAFALTTATLVALAFVRHVADGTGFEAELRHNTFSGEALYPVDGTLIFAGVAVIPRMLSADWFLAPSPSLWFVVLFLQFYLVYPLLFRAMRLIGPWPFLAATLAITLASRVPLTASHQGFGLLFNWWVDASYLPFNLFTFGLGMALAQVFTDDPGALRRYTVGRTDALLLVYAGLVVHTGGSLAQGRSGLISVVSGPMIILGLTMIVLPLIANTPGERSQRRLFTMLASLGAISYSLLIASDPLQFVVGTMHQMDAPAAGWALLWVLYAPVLLGLAVAVERASRALVAIRLGRPPEA